MISIIIPAFNRQSYIEQCVRSVLVQSFQDFEIIITDDGSTDRTGFICDSLASYDARIKVVHQANGGVSAARQTGIDIASGEWICFLDSDDSLPEKALENYADLIAAGEPDIIVTGYAGELDTRQFLLGITDYSVCPALWGKLFKADFLKKNMPTLPRKLVMGEDMIANLVLGLNAGTIASLPELQYQINLENPSSVMKTFRKSFDYENFFFIKLDELFLSRCTKLPYYDELVKNVNFLKLNGYKNVVLDGNTIDITSKEWISFREYIANGVIHLAPSDKLFLKMINYQRLYCSLMNAYLKIRR